VYGDTGETPAYITDSIGVKLRLIPAGSFMMGSDSREARDDAKPVHHVEITRRFYMGVYQVTQELYETVMDENPSEFRGPDRPVESLIWNEAVEFCRRLSAKEGAAYRLPTEAEWEYAARAGSGTEFFWGDEMDGDYAWYDGNSSDETHPVGQKLPNAWGLHDTSGNVCEWCADWFAEDYYRSSPQMDPVGPSSGEYRVLRGGCWLDSPRLLRVSHRGGYRPGWYKGVGLRCVREAG